MNWKLLAVGAVALFLAGYAAGSCGKPTTDQIEAAHDSTLVAVERADESERARAELEVRFRDDSLMSAIRVDALLTEARAASARRPEMITEIVEREAPEDTAVARRVAVAVADSMEVHEIQPRDTAIVALRAAYVSQGALLAAERETRLAAQEGLRRALAERDLLRAERPSWVARNWWKVAIPVVAYGGWRAHAEIQR